jgi:hypothetical protein
MEDNIGHPFAPLPYVPSSTLHCLTISFEGGAGLGTILVVTEALQPDVTAAPKAQAVIAGRLARFSEPAAALAGAAAAIGRAFSPDVLQ